MPVLDPAVIQLDVEEKRSDNQSEEERHRYLKRTIQTLNISNSEELCYSELH